MNDSNGDAALRKPRILWLSDELVPFALRHNAQGTLMKVTFAYQMGKRIYLLNGIKGSVDLFRGRFLDERRRLRIAPTDIRNLYRVLRAADA
ncbi:MAG: hypothetical protein ACP5MK_03585 [Candidatus Micrarchaeia archaeon]